MVECRRIGKAQWYGFVLKSTTVPLDKSRLYFTSYRNLLKWPFQLLWDGLANKAAAGGALFIMYLHQQPSSIMPIRPIPKRSIESIAHILISFVTPKAEETEEIPQSMTELKQIPPEVIEPLPPPPSRQSRHTHSSSDDDDEFTGGSDVEASDESDREAYRRPKKSSPSSPLHGYKKRPGSHEFSPAQKSLLQSWWNEHFHFPRPSREDLAYLSKAGGLNRTKVYKWFDNQRTRYLAKHGDAPFNGATKRGRPGKSDQPVVIDAREAADPAEAIAQVVTECDEQMSSMSCYTFSLTNTCSADPSVVMVRLLKERHHAGDLLLRKAGAIHFRHAHNGIVLVFRPHTHATVAQLWPAIRDKLCNSIHMESGPNQQV